MAVRLSCLSDKGQFVRHSEFLLLEASKVGRRIRRVSGKIHWSGHYGISGWYDLLMKGFSLLLTDSLLSVVK